MRLCAIRLIDGPLSPGQISVCIRDASEGAIRLTSAVPLELGWDFLLAHRDSGRGIWYRTTWCHASGSLYSVGASLVATGGAGDAQGNSPAATAFA